MWLSRLARYALYAHCVAKFADAVKRVVIGRALPSEGLQETLLSKRLALPIFASDPLSSVAYATQEILLVLTLGGLAYLYLTSWVAVAVVCLMAVVVLSYRQVVRAYPSGGGSYEVVSTNLGPSAGLVVAASLLVDYVMTVAVSVASGVDNIISAIPALNDYRAGLAVIFVVLLAAVNLRGVRESGNVFAAPTYLFIGGVLIMCASGLFRWAFGDAPVAESAAYGVTPTPGHADLAGFALLMLALRAFSSGCTALTGVEAISNGVPAFRKPKSKNAATTMAAMGIIAVVMFSGITTLATVAKVHITTNTCDLTGFRGNCHTTPQRTVIAQLAAAVFGGSDSIGFFYIQAATALVLVLAANTAFNGFPCCRRSSLSTGTCPASSIHAATASPSPTASSPWPWSPAPCSGRTTRRSPASSISTSLVCSPPSRSPSPAWCGTGTAPCAPKPIPPCGAASTVPAWSMG